jgi:hypothetical protein
MRSLGVVGLGLVVFPACVLVHEVLDRAAQAVTCVGARRASQVLARYAQADVRGAAQVLGRGAQAVARGAARLASQALNRGAQIDSRGIFKLFNRGAQADAHGAAQVLHRGA